MFRKKSAAIISMFLLSVCFAVHAFASTYLANTKSGKYHISTCRTIKKQNASHFVKYNSAAECEAAGYIKCKICFGR